MIVGGTPTKTGKGHSLPPGKRQDAYSTRRNGSEGIPAPEKRALTHKTKCPRPGCSNLFEKKRSDQEYCSPKCRKLAWQDRKYLEPIAKLRHVVEQLLVHCEERQATTIGNARLEVDVLAARNLLEKLDEQ